MPAASSVQHMFGNVKRRSVRRPQVSMVYRTGKANTNIVMPNPQDTSRAVIFDAPAWLKMVEE